MIKKKNEKKTYLVYPFKNNNNYYSNEHVHVQCMYAIIQKRWCGCCMLQLQLASLHLRCHVAILKPAGKPALWNSAEHVS